MLELARPNDHAAIESLAQQLHRLHVNWRPDVYENTQELWSQARFDQAVLNRQLFSARMDGQIVGYVLVRVRDSQMPGHIKQSVLLIDEICVDAGLRNHGIGTQIMIEVCAIAKAFGCADLQLGVYPQNNEALAFFQKCGFRIQSVNMHLKLR